MQIKHSGYTDMEDEKIAFLNLIVKSIKLDSIQKFMTAWMAQECKDFNIVFIYEDIDNLDCFNTDETKAIEYAKKFAESVGHSEMVKVVKNGKSIPSSQFNIVCDDTNQLPVDNLEIQRFKKNNVKEEQNIDVNKENFNLKQKDNVYFNNDNVNLIKNTNLSDIEKSNSDENNIQNINENVFFKIIVPNYNNMPYIKKCLDSIINQTFQDFKIIIVDDLSTDESDKFCQMYAKKHSKKIIYHQLSKKGYAGACRNWAID